MQIDKSDGGGTRFRITLPHASPGAPRDAEAAGEKQRMRRLTVRRLTLNRRLASVRRKSSCSVLTCGPGRAI